MRTLTLLLALLPALALANPTTAPGVTVQPTGAGSTKVRVTNVVCSTGLTCTASNRSVTVTASGGGGGLTTLRYSEWGRRSVTCGPTTYDGSDWACAPGVSPTSMTGATFAPYLHTDGSAHTTATTAATTNSEAGTPALGRNLVGGANIRMEGTVVTGTSVANQRIVLGMTEYGTALASVAVPDGSGAGVYLLQDAASASTWHCCTCNTSTYVCGCTALTGGSAPATGTKSVWSVEQNATGTSATCTLDAGAATRTTGLPQSGVAMYPTQRVRTTAAAASFHLSSLQIDFTR